MKKTLKSLLVIPAVALLTLVGCSSSAPSAPSAPSAQEEVGELKVVTSFTILEDMVREIGGDLVTVHNLVPTGTDPHEYEPLPADLRAAADADLLFYNGLNLEGGSSGWFARLVESVGQPDSKIFEVSAEIEPLYLGEAGSRDEEINPHGFTDPNNGVLMAEAILEGLQTVDPQNSEAYADRASKYIERITTIEADYAKRLGEIPDEQRILVTSERAFQYLAKRYSITEAFLWEIDTDENGSATQIKELVEFLQSSSVASLVLESNVDPRPMQTVSEETQLPIYDKKIFSDEIGDANDPDANSYLMYLTHNLEVIVGAMTS